MGRQAYAIAGGIIGAGVAFLATGGTATFQGYAAGFALGSTVGGIAGSYIDPIVLQGNTVGDNQIQVAAEGGARAIVFGRGCITATCIVARGNRQVIKKKTSNGKGSSGSTQNETVTWTFAIGLGEAMVNASISRIWQDETLVYDVLGDGAVSTEDNDKFAAKFRFYDGNESQLPDADLQVFLGDDTPYFRGTAYAVFPNFDLTAFSERIPTFKFEVLNGVSGIVDDLETLSWSITSVGPGLLPSSQSVTLTGSPDVSWNVDLYFTGSMELRDYTNTTAIVGGDGHFVTASDPTSTEWPGANIYTVTIDHPPQIYYVNNFRIGVDTVPVYAPDGSTSARLSIQVAGNATITYTADPDDGRSGFAPQYGSARAEITGTANGTVTLSSVVASLMERAGLTEDQFDVTALTDQIAGVCIQSTVTGSDAVGTCIQPFFIDPCERDGVLTFVRRGGDVLRTLTIDDLTETPDITNRENAIEYPAKLNFFYQSPQTGYATTKATSYRYSPQSDSSSDSSISTPITFYTSEEPAQIAHKLHKVMWTEADGSFIWTVGMRCIDLLPTDVVGLFLRGIVTRARIINIENDGSVLKLTLIKDRQSSYTSNVTAIPLPIPTPPQPTTMSKAVLAVMDIPALVDSDDQLCYYTAMSGSTQVWSGGQLQRSLDSGASWAAIGEVTTDVTMGRLTTAMTAALAAYTDTTNTVTVQLFDARNDIVALSDTTFLQEQGAIAIQMADGTWEVLQYRDAIDGGNGLWALSYLQRGRLNTAPGAHEIDALFVLLDISIVKNTGQSAWIAGNLQHRAISYGSNAEDADVVSVVYSGKSQQEWAPAGADALYDGTWMQISHIVPRHRFGTEVAPIASSNFIGFRIVASDGTGNVTTDISGADSDARINVGAIGTMTSLTVAAVNRIMGAGDTLAVPFTTVAPGSLPPTFSSVCLQLHFDGTNGATSTIDSSSQIQSVSMVGCTISTTQSRFGGSSLKPVAGTSSYAQSTTVVPLTSQEWTIEVSIYVTGTSEYYVVATSITNSFCPIAILVNSAQKIRVTGFSSALARVFDLLSAGPITLNTWTQLQVRRRNGVSGSDVIDFSINSVAEAATQSLTSGTILYSTSNVITVGGSGGSSESLAGYVDEFRFTNNVARAFALQTAPFPDF